jgi:O-methyltransferase involved in polyketide biosynthesis
VVNTEDYHLIGCDLQDLVKLEQMLRDKGADFNLPTLFLSECVLVYIDPAKSDKVIRFAAEKFKGGCVFVTYEQIRPDDPFGRTMVDNLEVSTKTRSLLPMLETQ